MKLFTRIMVVLMALVLALGVSVASAAPANLSEIEGLPECPEAPQMKVKRVGQDYTITLSAPLTWLNVIQNWQWMDIITWNEDKTVGTYSAAGLKSAPGTGTWNNHSSWDEWYTWIDPEGIDEYMTEYAEYILPYDYQQWWLHDDDEIAFAKEFAEDNAYWAGSHLYTGKQYATEDWWVDEEDPEAEPEFVGYDVWKPVLENKFGAYALGGDVDQFAYDGGLEDGSDVKYSQGGKLVTITVTKTGVNYLGSDKEPVKTEVGFRRMYGKMYLYSIKETYDDDTTQEAVFNFNGVRIALH